MPTDDLAQLALGDAETGGDLLLTLTRRDEGLLQRDIQGRHAEILGSQSLSSQQINRTINLFISLMMLTGVGRTTCGVKFLAYNRVVDHFGFRLRFFREEVVRVGATEMSRRAFEGDDTATEEEIRNFASYVGRIERGVRAAQNPGLDMLERLAKGLDLALPVFLARLNDLQIVTGSQQDKPLFELRATLDDSSTVPADSSAAEALSDLRAFITNLAATLGTAAAGELPRRSLAGASANEAKERKVVD